MGSIWLNRPSRNELSALVKVGDLAPETASFSVTDQTSLISFIRHVGCPFAENTVKKLRAWSENYPHIAVVVVSHGSEANTSQWISDIGGAGRIQVVIDTERESHGKWGVGLSGFWHFAGPQSLFGAMALLMKGIHNRSAAGTRWQRAGMFLVKEKKVMWVDIPESAEQLQLPPTHLIEF